MFLALKELKYSKFRFTMIAFIVVMIAWLVFLLSGLANGLQMLGAGALKNMDVDYIVLENGARASMRRSFLDEELLIELEALDQVEAVTLIGNAMLRIYNIADGGDKVDVSVLAIEPGGFLEPVVTEGTQLNLDQPLGVIVDASLQSDGFEIGSQIEVEGFDEQLIIVGFVDDQSYSYSPVVFTTLDTWRGIQFGDLINNEEMNHMVNGIILQGENINPEELVELFPEIEVVSQHQFINGVPGYSEQSLTFNMMIIFLLVISAFVLAIFFYVLTLQKANQFGVLKAIGASNLFLGRAVVFQVFVLSLISIILGGLLAYGMSLAMPDAMPFAWDFEIVMTYSVAILAISMISSLLSVRRITKIDPLQAIGRVE